MCKKKQILIVYSDMILGGSTSALIAFLKKIDYHTVDIDLLFLNNGSYRLEELPPQVHVLPDAVQFDLLSKKTRQKKICNFLLREQMALNL